MRKFSFNFSFNDSAYLAPVQQNGTNLEKRTYLPAAVGILRQSCIASSG